MPTRDNYSDQRSLLAFNAVISTDTTTVSPTILDTADYDMGIFFSFAILEFSAGNYGVIINESDDAGMAGKNLVASKNILGGLPELTSLTSVGEQLKDFGIVGTKRYVEISVVSTGSSGTNRIVVTAVEKGEYNPQVRT